MIGDPLSAMICHGRGGGNAGMFEMALDALVILADPSRLLFLCLGVMFGLVLGVVPGLGGVVGLSLLLPFTFDMDPYAALAFLMGLSSVVVTSDTISSILLGVPGTVGSAATIVDGYPMARKGEAGRAFGAAFSASILGGLFGALLLALSIPVMRPVILAMGTPDQLAFAIFGISVAAVLSGGSPLKGLAGACIGLLIATAGDDPQTGTLRWTFNLLYLWDGLSIVPLALGIFALPELADLVIQRRPIHSDATARPAGRMPQLEGVRDTLRCWWLTLRCASIGVAFGAIPGIGASVIDWVAYGHAARTEKGAAETFGTGDVRGVIASEASNNAKEGGALIPTIAFGVPGSASMVLILGAFVIHGITPGPEMLGKRLDVTFTLVWSVALANILGGAVCFAFAHQLARIALVRIGILAPVVLAVVFIGAYQGSRQWGDIYALLLFGLLGWVLKRLRWPRPPLILGFVLGEVIEGYMFISVQLYEWGWMLRPIVLVMFAIALFGIVHPIVRGHRARRQAGAPAGDSGGWSLAFNRQRLSPDFAFNVIVLLMFLYVLWVSSAWEYGARLMPQVVGMFGAAFVAARIAIDLFVARAPAANGDQPGFLGAGRSGFHFDSVTDFGGLTERVILTRGGIYFAWCLVYFGTAAIIGLLPAMLVFLIGYIRFEARERWPLTLAVALPMWLFCYILFHNILHIPWPQSVVGDLFPALRTIPAINLF